MAARWLQAMAVLVCAGGCATDTAPTVRIFAAASTTRALREALELHEAEGGPSVQAIVGASSSLALQIEQGAPADLFLSANPAWMDHLEQGGHLAVDSRVDLLANQLVLVAPIDASVTLALSPGVDLVGALQGGRLAVGDPDHVPAGQYARDALRELGVWDFARPHLAPAADVRAALALVEQGEAPLGVVYATDAIASENVRVVARFAPQTITYPLAAIAHGTDPGPAERTRRFLQSDAAQAVFANHGFSSP